ncbi:MAG: hypothetical protein OXP28_14670 [Gammaproteobacteria bacterium]|nr:hypothetical protein [Gammaproteobacteria bacterium]
MKPEPRPVQRFTAEYLERCSTLSPDDVARFLEDFKRIQGASGARSRLISLKVPEPLLAAFKIQARLSGVRYQTQIKTLMRDWLGIYRPGARTIMLNSACRPDYIADNERLLAEAVLPAFS